MDMKSDKSRHIRTPGETYTDARNDTSDTII